MAKLILKKPVIKINKVDLTKRISQLAMNLPDEEVDVTAFGADFKQTEKGLSDGSMNFHVFQDYAKGMVDAVLWPLKKESTPFVVEVQPLEGEPSETNPCYVMGAKLFNYDPLSGSVGQPSTTEPTMKNVTQYGIERCISKAEVEAAAKKIEEAFA